MQQSGQHEAGHNSLRTAESDKAIRLLIFHLLLDFAMTSFVIDCGIDLTRAKEKMFLS